MATTRVEMSFNHIYVVQSLPPAEDETGKQLYEEKLKRLAEFLNKEEHRLGVEFVKVATLEQLYGFLESVRTAAIEKDQSPILHLEIHGASDKTGLILQSGEFVPWQSLFHSLTGINDATRNNLLVTLAVCNGAYLGTILNAARPAPFWGLVAPDRSEWTIELLEGFKAFYHALLVELDGDKAVERLREVTSRSGNAKYLFINAEKMFKAAFRAYVSEALTPDTVRARVAALVEKVKDERRNSGLDVASVNWNEIAAKIEKQMLDPRPPFERFRRTFFLIDKYPENGPRFPITLEDVLGQGG